MAGQRRAGMSAVLSHQATTQTDVAARLAFQKQLQAVTNKIHATSNIDEIMLEVSADICALFNADRLTIYSVGEDEQAIAGYVALAKKTVNLKDVYDDGELRALNANLRFLQEVDKRTGYRTKQMLVAPIVEPGTSELIGVIQIINNKTGVPFGGLAEEGVLELAQTLAIAFKQRQKPQLVKTKYDYLIADAVLSAGEFELASRQARKKAIDVEQVLTDEFQVKIPAIGAALSKFFGVPYEAFKADRVKPTELLKNLKREYVEANQWLAIDDTKEGLVVLCLDPERIRSSRIASNVFPKSRLLYKVTTQKEFRETINQFYGQETAMDTGNIDELLSGLEDETPEALDGGRQRAGEAGEQGHHRSLQSGRLGYPHRALPGQGQDRDPLQEGRLARTLYRGAGELPRGACRPPQDHVRPGHLREEKAPGRQDQVQEIRAARHRAARRDDPDGGRRRGHRDADTRRGRADSAGKNGVQRAQHRRAATRGVQALRPILRLRANRLGQDHHAALGAEASQHPGYQDLDRRGPGRDHAEGPAPGPGEQEGGPRLRRGDEGLPARRSGHHHGGRDARQGDHLDRHRSLAHRPPGVRHPAYQLCAGIDHPPPRHGDGPVQLLRCAARRPGAGPRQAPVRLQAGLQPGAGGTDLFPARVLRGADEHAPVQGGPEGRDGGGLQGVGEDLR